MTDPRYAAFPDATPERIRRWVVGGITPEAAAEALVELAEDAIDAAELARAWGIWAAVHRMGEAAIGKYSTSPDTAPMRAERYRAYREALHRIAAAGRAAGVVRGG